MERSEKTIRLAIGIKLVKRDNTNIIARIHIWVFPYISLTSVAERRLRRFTCFHYTMVILYVLHLYGNIKIQI